MFPRIQWERVCLAVRVLIGILVAILPASGEEPKGDRFLGGERPRYRGEYGNALKEIIPIRELPPRIKFQREWRSLIPDPSDTKGNSMVVYLVNDTDQPVPRAVGELQKASSQMNIAGNWFARDPEVYDCGTVPSPKDLPARHALALGVRRPGLGDTDGVIRYFFQTAEVFSEPMPGRYESAQADWMLKHWTSSSALQEAFETGFEKGHWEAGEVAKDPEDFAALLEIVRHHQLCVSQKPSIHEWIQRERQQPNPNTNLKRALDRMDETLWKAWICHDDSQAMVNRCVTALEAPPPGEFGAPERCVGVVWRYLCHGEVARAVGKADAPSKAKLVKLAKTAIKGTNHSSRNGAALFLARRTDDSEFPTARFHEFLESGVPELRHAGLEGLARRGKAHEAGPWMLRLAPDDPALCEYYRILRRSLHGEIQEWEAEVIKRLLDHQAVVALFMMSVLSRNDSSSLPSLCEASLRKALAKELEPARKAWWDAQAMRGANESEMFPERFFPQGLRYGIRQLDKLGAAEDTGLFTEFLDHPAGGFGSSGNGNPIRFFTVRGEAKAALLQRHIPLVAAVVTEVELPAASEVPSEGVKKVFADWHSTVGLYGLLGAACFMVGFQIWRTKTK